MAKMITKSELIQKITDQHAGLTKKDVKGVMDSLATVAYKELKKTGVFLLPGFAKFVVIKKPATKERAGINPFTKEPTVFKARPARKRRCSHVRFGPTTEVIPANSVGVAKTSSCATFSASAAVGVLKLVLECG